MSDEDAAPVRKALIIAVSATVIAVISGLSMFTMAKSETAPLADVTTSPTVIATSCDSFAADAAQLFDKGGPAVLRGTFSRGDHVHLAIDLRGAGYSWELTGALGESPHVTPSILWVMLLKTTKWHTHTTTTFTPASASTPASSSTISDGNITGYARWEVDFGVATAGEGALTINQTSGALTPPRIAIASCHASETADAHQRHDASGS